MLVQLAVQTPSGLRLAEVDFGLASDAGVRAWVRTVEFSLRIEGCLLQPFHPIRTHAIVSAMNRSDDFHCFRPVAPEARWESIAAVLEADSAAWDLALENIDRWLAQGRLNPTPLLEWRERLIQSRHEEGERQALLESLRHAPANAHEAQLRSCSPFVGGPFQAPSPLAPVS